jgi:hypothetical protein
MLMAALVSSMPMPSYACVQVAPEEINEIFPIFLEIGVTEFRRNFFYFRTSDGNSIKFREVPKEKFAGIPNFRDSLEW